MDRFFARMLLVCLLGPSSTLSVVAAESPAISADLVISSGVEGSGYWSAAARLQAVANEMHFVVENRPSSGSLENLEQLLDMRSPVNLAFAQADAAQYYLNKHHGEIKKLDLLENIGQECVFIVTGIDSAIRTDQDMQNAKKLRLGIASADSGMAATFNYMASQIPEMADIEVRYGDTLATMNQLNARDSKVDAIMMVHRPKEHSAEVKYALDHADRYRFVELSDERLTQQMWNGREIYRTMKLAMPGAEQPVKTICVAGLLLANKQKLTIEQRNQLSDLVSYHWMEVYATQ